MTRTPDRETINTFLSIGTSKHCDDDGLELGPAKHVLDAVTPAFTHICDLVLFDGTFPESYSGYSSVAKAIELRKGGDKNDLTNYTPISILKFFSEPLGKGSQAAVRPS